MPVETSLGAALRALLAALDDQVLALYQQRDETFRPRYFPVWRALARGREASVGGLAAAAGVSQPAMTQTLAAMERDGLVSLRPASDRRRRIYRLTAEGVAQGERLQPLFAAIARAASELEREAGTDLISQTDALLGALARRPFGERIADQLGDKS